ncbi:hypothetical protein REPUB_Repub11eG0170700 [Reevesia pubescens]
MQQQIVEHNPTSPMFRSSIKLPHGWIVEQRPRVNSSAHPGRVDKYYYELGSGRLFRSLTAVHKMQIVPQVSLSFATFNLPPGWVVEEKPRSNARYAGLVDRYYIEPGTGKRFRSMIAVERHLAEMEASAAASKVPTAGAASKLLIYNFC